jgi:RND family efflux transporter MFP subunit
VAQENRDQVKTLLQYTKLEAPYTGRVIKRNANTGDLVQPTAGSGSKGEPLFVVARLDPVRIFVEVPETDAALVAEGTPARIRVRGLPGEEFAGKVARSAWALDLKARTLRAEVDVRNPGGKLRPGMYVFASITVEHPNVWTVPVSAIVTQAEQTFCYRVQNDKAVRTPLKVGIRSGSLVEVLKQQTKPAKSGEEAVWEDLTGQEEVVQSNAGALTDGQAVKISSGKE